MPSTDCTRRHALATGCLALAGLAGCLTGSVDVDSNASPTATTTSDSDTDDEGTDSKTTDEISLVELAVADFVEYPLAGVHPHVHARRDTQYVVVSVDSALDGGPVRERLDLQLDGEAMALADRQPVPWESTTDLAFAVSKAIEYDAGTVVDGDTVLHSLSPATLERLNNPPRFRVSDLSVSPAEISPDEQTTATVRAAVENVGDGAGTFGVSLKGNYISGSTTVTMALDAGATGELEGTAEIVGDGDEAPVRLDWGRDEWETGIPVRETTTTASTTATE